MNVVKEADKKKALTVISNMAKRNIEGFYCDTKEEAVRIILELMPEGSTAGWGGSVTLDQLGIKEKLVEEGYTVYDRGKADRSERAAVMKKAHTADFFLSSANAITHDGIIVNIDGAGNRVSAICSGPKHVLIIAGINKIEPTLDTAIDRVQNKATPPNALRLHAKTPCSETGICHDCLGPDTLCCQILITRMSKMKNRIKVILVNEVLGF